MANGRQNFSGPTYTPSRFGLLTAATDMSASAPANWGAGLTWQVLCPDQGDGTYDACLQDIATDPDTPTATPEPKAVTSEFSMRGATSFAVYAKLDCSPPGFWDRAEAVAAEALAKTEGREVERIFDSGVAPRPGTSPVTVYPHLRSTTEVVDDDSQGAMLQSIPDVITTTPVDIVEAIGRLESAMGLCYGGQGVIHVPTQALAELTYYSLVTRQGDVLTSPSGHRVAVGSGYSGASPAGVITDSVAWIYATGSMFYIRSDVRVMDLPGAFDRNVNTVEALAERQYILGWDCCHFAIPVYLGGVESGEFDSAGPLIGGS